MDVQTYLEIREAVVHAGYGEEIDWAEKIGPPADAEDFALEACFVILNSGMKAAVCRKIWPKVRDALLKVRPVITVFGHGGKAEAMESIWVNREHHYRTFMASPDKLAYCRNLPWIGEITQYHLAKNLGVDCAKPDRHLERVAARAGENVKQLCGRLAHESGDRVATVDTVIWRACEQGILDSTTGERRMF